MADQSAPSFVALATTLLVGREREMAALREALAAALSGRGSLVLIGGEAGIGKTALAEWLLAEATDRGATVLVGRCYDLAETPPYGPWAEALARAPRGDDLPPPPDLAGGGAASQAALFGQVRDHLATLVARPPLVVLLEDLHWADPASLDLLRFLGRGLADLPVLLLATYRADELTRRHPLYQLLPVLVREARAVRLDLRPLAADTLRLLVRHYRLPDGDEDRLVAYLGARAEGNPFYTGELLRALEEASILARSGAGSQLGDPGGLRLPPFLRQVIDARVDRLGEEVSLDLWAAVAGADEEALLAAIEPAAAAGLLAETATGVRFAHALTREALYAGTPGIRRRAWHRQLADALLATTAPDPDAVAHHLQRAGDPRAVDWLMRAGERAARAFAYAIASARFEAALALRGDDPARAGERGWLQLRLALARRYGAGGPDLAAVDEAVRLAGEVGDAALIASARFAAGERALGPAGFQMSPDETLVSALLMSWQIVVGDFAAARALEPRVGDAVARLDAAVTAGSFVAAHAARGLAYMRAMLGEADAAWETAVRAREAHRARGIAYLVVQFTRRDLMENVALPYWADRPELWRRLAVEAAEGARASLAPDVAWHEGHSLFALLVEGRWDACAALEEAGYRPWVAAGQVARHRGRRAAAWAIVRRELPQGPATAPGGSNLNLGLWVQRLAAALALDAGDPPTAQAWLAAHDRWLAWSGAVLGRAEGALGWAAYHRAVGDPDAAHERAEAALAHASEPRQPLALLAAHRLRGGLASDMGAYDQAQAELDAALALAEACTAPYERALTLLALAELRAAEARGEEATAALAEARTVFADLGAAPAMARADALAARLAAPPPADRTALPPFGLTAREAEVLRLVAQGLTDAQVGARLFVSRHTVSTHLRAIYGKLGVTSRSAATAVAIDHGLR